MDRFEIVFRETDNLYWYFAEFLLSHLFINPYYRTTRTGQLACEITPLETLPMSIFLKPPRPRVPTMIRSTSSLAAWLIMVSTTDDAPSGSSVLTFVPTFFASETVSPTIPSATLRA